MKSIFRTFLHKWKNTIPLLTIFLATTTVAIAQETEQDSLRLDRLQKLDEVLVKSVRVDADSPITHSNLDKEEIKERNLGQDIPFLLNFMPSVVSTSDAGAGVGYTYIRVRGSDASRVNVTLNGIPFNDSESQGSFWVNLPDFASSTENMQLQRGVGTSTNGSGAFGASLNLLTDAVSKDAYGEIGNSFGSFNTRRHNVKFSTGLLQKNTVASTSLSHQEQRTENNKNQGIELAGRVSTIKSDGYIDRASSDLKSYFLQASYVDDNTLIKAIAFGGYEKTYVAWNGIDPETMAENPTFNSAGMYTDADGNTQFYDNEIDDYKQDHYQLHWNQRFNNYWSTNIGLNYTKGRGYFEQYKEDADLAEHGINPIEIKDTIIANSDLIRRRWLDNDYYVLNANTTYKKDNLEVTSGVFYSYYGGDHYGEVIWARFAGDSEIRDRYYFSDASKHEFTVFSKATYKINNKWQVFGDVQGRFNRYKTYGITSEPAPIDLKEKYNFFNPKAGVSFTLNEQHQFYASYGRAHREPTRNDFEEGITTPEKLDDFELGWRFANQNTKINTNLFFMNYKNQLVLSGEVNDVGAPLRTTSGKSYRFGVEVDADIKVTNWLKTIPTLAVSTNKNEDFIASIDDELVNLGTTDISFSPSVVASNMLVFQPTRNFQIGLLSKFVGEQYMDNINQESAKLDSFFVNDLNVVYELDNVPFFESILLNGLVNNVFDTTYISNGYMWGEYPYYYPQAGINFLVGATLRF